jgi:hypothetical protein
MAFGGPSTPSTSSFTISGSTAPGTKTPSARSRVRPSPKGMGGAPTPALLRKVSVRALRNSGTPAASAASRAAAIRSAATPVVSSA